MHFNWADYAIIVIIILSVGISFIRGFVREILSILGWIIVFWVSIVYFDSFANLLTPFIKSQTSRQVISFVFLFISILVIVLLLNYLISKMLLTRRFDGTDRILGVFFGLIRGILLISVLLLLASLTNVTQSQWWNDSVTIPKFDPIVEWLKSLLPEDIDQTMKIQPPNTDPVEGSEQATGFHVI